MLFGLDCLAMSEREVVASSKAPLLWRMHIARSKLGTGSIDGLSS